jgi:tetratricopeptide (TPR) repeat protein
MLLAFGREYLRRRNYDPFPVPKSETDGFTVKVESGYWVEFLIEAGRYDEAIPLIEDRLKARRWPEYDMLKRKELLYKRSGRLKEVVPLIEARLQMLPKADPVLADELDCTADLAEAYIEAGLPDKSPSLIAAAWKKLPSAGDERSGYTNLCRVRLLKLAEKSVSPEQFEMMVADVLRAARAGQKHREDDLWQEIFRQRMRQKRYADAEAIAHEWVTVESTKKREGLFEFMPLLLLGQALLARGKFREAEPLLRDGFMAGSRYLEDRGYGLRSQYFFWENLRDELTRLVELYEALKQPEIVAMWKSREQKFRKLGEQLKRRNDALPAFEDFGLTVHRLPR